MSPTSAFCRAQEALQRKRAADTTLTNVREIAEKAAAAWAIEAVQAEARELRQGRTKSASPDLTAEELDEGEDELDERGSSENPDQGFAHA